MLKKTRCFIRATRVILIVVAVILTSIFAYWFVWSATIRTPHLPDPPLKDLAARHGVALGLLTKPDRLPDNIYAHIITSQYSFITSDSEIHWDKLRPSPTDYNFVNLDKLVDFAQANHMTIQAHHLLWGEKDSLPGWLKNENYTRQQLLDLIRAHIETVVGRYKGKIVEWTVANEYFTRAQHIFGRSDWWADHLKDGTSHIDDVFIWAHQVDPRAKLILNDFYNESATSVSDAEYTYIRSARKRGVPIDGVGMQMHVDASRPPQKDQMILNMKRFAALGVPVYITEFDVNSNTVKGSASYKSQLEAQITATAVRACVESRNCVSFDVFGMTAMPTVLDWLTGAKLRSYLLTERYEPEASFYAFRQAWAQP